MERVLSWLNQPRFPDTVIRVWMAVAAGAALLLALILAFFLIRRKKKKKRGDQAVEEPITERPEPLPALELAHPQGVGSRGEPARSGVELTCQQSKRDSRRISAGYRFG